MNEEDGAMAMMVGLEERNWAGAEGATQRQEREARGKPGKRSTHERTRTRTRTRASERASN